MSLFTARYELTKAVMDRADANSTVRTKVAQAADTHRNLKDATGEERVVLLSTMDVCLHHALEESRSASVSRHIDELRDIVIDEIEEEIQ